MLFDHVGGLLASDMHAYCNSLDSDCINLILYM